LSGSCSREARGRARPAAHQAAGEIVEIVQPLAQIWIGLAQHAGAVVGLHALDRGFGGEPGRHRLVHLVGPAAVVANMPIGFEHLAVLAAVGDVARSSRRRGRRATR
jgi:hypothetical protein